MADENYSDIPGLTADEIAAVSTTEKLDGEEQVIGDDDSINPSGTETQTPETQAAKPTDETAAAQAAGIETATAQAETATAQGTATPATVETTAPQPDLNQQLAQAQHQLDENLKAAVKQLAQQYEDGEIDFTDLEAGKTELMLAHQRQSEQYKQTAAAYQSEISALNKSHPNWEKTGNSPEFVRWLQKQPPGIQAMANTVNAQNYAYLLDSFTAAGGQSNPEKPQPKKPEVVLPTTLAGIPSAALNTDTGEFAHLENLSGMEYEAALSKLTPEQQAKYLNS
jgi:F0F1-type ATP synthase membrane subunit c/vacuolar-type H+-ATPase subunit K